MNDVSSFSALMMSLLTMHLKSESTLIILAHYFQDD